MITELIINSPLTSGPVTRLTSINTKDLIASYKSTFNIDTSSFFQGKNEIFQFKCLNTGYRFFYPFSIAGDSSFYEQLEQFAWYYMPWKWEHQNALKYIKPGQNVLEVGAAQGSFIERLKNNDNNATGLELNQKAVRQAKENDINLNNESIEVHASKNRESYDVVCSFQVLEHIANVSEFITSSLDALKPGGLFIVSVPNNDSFLGKSYNILNLPPHHMGLWNEKSLRSLVNYFPLKFKDVYLEPLQPYHLDYFNNTVIDYLNTKLKIRKSFLARFKSLFTYFSSKRFKAFTIQVVFEKL
jgi:2-polyprenyl-3-methyl-5-hydroxy-6-metoxy-1,4-benzoquinol methylase